MLSLIRLSGKFVRNCEGVGGERDVEIHLFVLLASSSFSLNPPKKPGPYFLSTPQNIKGPFSDS